MSDVLQTLRSLGKASYAKIYRRHGAVGEVLGVSYADLGKLTKQHHLNHALAQSLWKSGVHEARVLAAAIADPAQATLEALETWLADVEGYPLTDALASYVAKTHLAESCLRRWLQSPKEWTASAGWNLLTLAARNEGPADAFFTPFLTVIEREIQGAPNRVRHAMNSALIAIGGRGGALEKRAVAVAKKIGRVEVDHGDTDCQTPDAATYIAKMKARTATKKAPAKPATKTTKKKPANRQKRRPT